jgi:hypothetical protein
MGATGAVCQGPTRSPGVKTSACADDEGADAEKSRADGENVESPGVGHAVYLLLREIPCAFLFSCSLLTED